MGLPRCPAILRRVDRGVVGLRSRRPALRCRPAYNHGTGARQPACGPCHTAVGGGLESILDPFGKAGRWRETQIPTVQRIAKSRVRERIRGKGELLPGGGGVGGGWGGG